MPRLRKGFHWTIVSSPEIVRDPLPVRKSRYFLTRVQSQKLNKLRLDLKVAVSTYLLTYKLFGGKSFLRS